MSSDVISLHCPLTAETRHLIGRSRLRMMKREAILINTSRGGLIDSEALLEHMRGGHLGGACLDVYEEETELFFEDLSDTPIRDELLTTLLSMPNVIVTSHQAFLTAEALAAISETTSQNIVSFFETGACQHAIT